MEQLFNLYDSLVKAFGENEINSASILVRNISSGFDHFELHVFRFCVNKILVFGRFCSRTATLNF
mgnify:CR=1 FL=1